MEVSHIKKPATNNCRVGGRGRKILRECKLSQQAATAVAERYRLSDNNK